MNTEALDGQTVSFRFDGSVFGLFGRSLAMWIASLFIIPAPWVFAWYYRWIVNNIRMSDGSTLAFVGEGRQIWLPAISLMFVGLVSQLVSGLLSIPLMLLNYYLMIVLMRWFFTNIRPDSGARVSFTGRYLPYLGWMVLTLLSILTIIGWAWVTAAMLRWICRNVHWEGRQVEFHGSGWGILWRTIVFGLTCLFIIPIPWMMLWIMKWYVSMTSLRNIANAAETIEAL